MPMKVRKAVFPAAGLGKICSDPPLRLNPKKCFPWSDKPIIQYGVEGCRCRMSTIIVTGRGKTAIEDHFDTSYELEAARRRKYIC